MALFLLVAYIKLQEERKKLKRELSREKEVELEDLENYQLIHLQKMRKSSLGRTLRVKLDNLC